MKKNKYITKKLYYLSNYELKLLKKKINLHNKNIKIFLQIQQIIKENKKQYFETNDISEIFYLMMDLPDLYYELIIFKKKFSQDDFDEINFLNIIEFFKTKKFKIVNFYKIYKKLFNGVFTPNNFIFLKQIIFKNKLKFTIFLKLIRRLIYITTTSIKKISNFITLDEINEQNRLNKEEEEFDYFIDLQWILSDNLIKNQMEKNQYLILNTHLYKYYRILNNIKLNNNLTIKNILYKKLFNIIKRIQMIQKIFNILKKKIHSVISPLFFNIKLYMLEQNEVLIWHIIAYSSYFYKKYLFFQQLNFTFIFDISKLFLYILFVKNLQSSFDKKLILNYYNIFKLNRKFFLITFKDFFFFDKNNFIDLYFFYYKFNENNINISTPTNIMFYLINKLNNNKLYIDYLDKEIDNSLLYKVNLNEKNLFKNFSILNSSLYKNFFFQKNYLSEFQKNSSNYCIKSTDLDYIVNQKIILNTIKLNFDIEFENKNDYHNFYNSISDSDNEINILKRYNLDNFNNYYLNNFKKIDDNYLDFLKTPYTNDFLKIYSIELKKDFNNKKKNKINFYQNHYLSNTYNNSYKFQINDDKLLWYYYIISDTIINFNLIKHFLNPLFNEDLCIKKKIKIYRIKTKNYLFFIYKYLYKKLYVYFFDQHKTYINSLFILFFWYIKNIKMKNYLNYLKLKSILI